jgi:hypothetical protein
MRRRSIADVERFWGAVVHNEISFIMVKVLHFHRPVSSGDGAVIRSFFEGCFITAFIDFEG